MGGCSTRLRKIGILEVKKLPKNGPKTAKKARKNHKEPPTSTRNLRAVSVPGRNEAELLVPPNMPADVC